ncbi:hypothetical protein [Burkholderia vietnamiensis]|uniref:hypothetical protein n=1 Tax=Burkholderia vietnamiensis TaxID=60552 RepID=UPI000B243835|nr:hypothetical protein [Burkholderia vietnamiensis]MDN8069668.1 hypothetical protein [Burkholderia vietnamiensis]
MSKFDNQEVWRARQHAQSALEILEAARIFNAAIDAYFAKPCAGKELGISLRTSSGDEAFSLQTPYGHVEVVFDIAMKNGALVGRYTFFLLRPIGAGNREVLHVWSMLINGYCAATWSVDEDFAWSYANGITNLSDQMNRLLLTILAHLHRAVST